MNVPNRNSSEYVTISATPFPQRTEGEEVYPLRWGNQPPTVFMATPRFWKNQRNDTIDTEICQDLNQSKATAGAADSDSWGLKTVWGVGYKFEVVWLFELTIDNWQLTIILSCNIRQVGVW